MGTVTRRASRPLRAGLALGLVAALVAGCDLFKPATPEVGGSGCNLLPVYDTPENCLYYMKLGIESKDDCGLGAYLGALADTTKDGMGFHAFFEKRVWDAFETTRPGDWNLGYEAQFLPLFGTVKLNPYQMKWLPDEVHPYDDLNPAGDRMILHRRYEVSALQDAPVDTLLIAVGYADLYFAKISASRWALYRWEDRLAPDAGGFPPDDLDHQCFGYRRLNAGAGG